MTRIPILLIVFANIFDLSNCVISGESAAPKEFPSVVKIMQTGSKNRTSSLVCTGTIINSNIVLTAAHCFNGIVNLQNYGTVAGDINRAKRDSSEQINFVQRILLHPLWKGYLAAQPQLYDVALIKLWNHFSYTDYVKPANIPQENLNISGEMTFSGWGRTKFPDREYANVLQKCDLSIMEGKLCLEEYYDGYREGSSSDKLICGVSENKVSIPCIADSGGGAYVKLENNITVIYAVLSGGISLNCSPDSPKVFVPLRADILDWINSSMELLQKDNSFSGISVNANVLILYAVIITGSFFYIVFIIVRMRFNAANQRLQSLNESPEERSRPLLTRVDSIL